MKIRQLIPFTFVVAFASAYAGSLRDRVAERLAERRAERESSQTDKVAAIPATRILRDISYGSDSAQKFDVYLPESPSNASVIFMVHGGGWRRGDKAMSNVVENKAARWLPMGFIIVSANYRMIPKADPAEQARDIARALAAAQRQAANWGGDRNKFILMGHSAGAHLVALLDVSPELRQGLSIAPWLGTISLDSGALDVVDTMQGRHPKLHDDAFGKDKAFWEKSSPMHMARSAGAPFLGVCSTKRNDDPCSENAAYVERLKSLGTRASVLRQPLTHGEINAKLGLPGAYTDAVESFLAGLHPDVPALLSRRQ